MRTTPSPITLVLMTALSALACDWAAEPAKPAAVAKHSSAVQSQSSQQDEPVPAQTAVDPAATADPVERVSACARACDAKDVSGTDRATCRLQCAASEHGRMNECERPCADALLDRWALCKEIPLPTDVATCELQCESDARRCFSACD